VQQALAHQDPYLLGEVGSGTSRVHDLLARYRRQGALGLLDKPRSGRPGSSDTLLQEVVAQSGEFHPAAAAAAIRKLPKSVREGIWRLNKRSGLTLDRDRRLKVSRVSGPIGFPELLGVLSLPGMLVLVTTKGKNAAQFSGGGMWLANGMLGNTRRKGGLASPSLTDAIAALQQNAGDHAHRAPSRARLTTEVFPSFHRSTAESMAEFGDQIRLDIGVSAGAGEHAMHYMPHLRDSPLMEWFGEERKVSRLGSGPRSVMRPYRSKLEMVCETLEAIRIIQRPRQEVVEKALAYDGYFCWMRVKVFEPDD
jgi:hypothetical protein